MWSWEVLRVGTHENRRPDKADKQSEKGARWIKAVKNIQNQVYTSDLLFDRATIFSRLISSITMSKSGKKTSIKYAKYRVQPQLTLIPTFYHLSYSNFRYEGSPARHAINQLSFYSGKSMLTGPDWNQTSRHRPKFQRNELWLCLRQ